MSYDPTQPTVLDKIRARVLDTDEDNEIFPDVEYMAFIDQHENWKRACAEMARRMASHLEAQQTSFTATGDMAVGWGDRARTMRGLADFMEAEADREDAAAREAGRLVTVSQDFLTGGHAYGGEY